jgi:hypothetical protein
MSVLTDLIYGGSNAVAGLTENAVNAALEEHGECVEINCLTCIVLGQQIERLKEKHNTEHTCHAVACDVCARMEIEEGLRSVVCLLSVFVLAYAAWRVIRFVLEEKTLFIRAFSLLGLKIRLNN